MKIATEEDEEPWDEILDDADSDVMKEIDDEVKEDYIEEKEN